MFISLALFYFCSEKKPTFEVTFLDGIDLHTRNQLLTCAISLGGREMTVSTGDSLVPLERRLLIGSRSDDMPLRDQFHFIQEACKSSMVKVPLLDPESALSWMSACHDSAGARHITASVFPFTDLFLFFSDGLLSLSPVMFHYDARYWSYNGDNYRLCDRNGMQGSDPWYRRLRPGGSSHMTVWLCVSKGHVQHFRNMMTEVRHSRIQNHTSAIIIIHSPNHYLYLFTYSAIDLFTSTVSLFCSADAPHTQTLMTLHTHVTMSCLLL